MLRPCSTASRDFMMAFWTTMLPAVRAVMSMPSRMGTPELVRVPRVRQNRATATLRRSRR